MSLRFWSVCAAIGCLVAVSAAQATDHHGYSIMQRQQRGTSIGYPPFVPQVAPVVQPPVFEGEEEEEVSASMALFIVDVPDNAEVWFSGEPTRQRGTRREFVSPPLNPDRRYAYEITARWTQDGQDKHEVRKVTFSAGDWVAVDFIMKKKQEK